MKAYSVIFVAIAFIALGGCNSRSSKSNPGTAVDTISSKSDPTRLAGDWIRSDGSYVLKIRSVSPDGKLDAGYFNPDPIHVARADWYSKENHLVIFVELQDVNYPGSTYTLVYLPSDDRLAGNYYQAVEKVNFSVEFTRQK